MRRVLLGMCFVACSGSGSPIIESNVDGGLSPSVDAAPPVPEPRSGTLSVLTYNVAGLPQGLSGSNPAVNARKMSPLLNAFDVALVQEDFSYHEELSADAEHPYQSEPFTGGGDVGASFGDGLNRFSRIPFGEHQRVEWDECSGWVDSKNDCLTPKGFSIAVHELVPGRFVAIINLHMDAGRGDGDREARLDQVEQLSLALNELPSDYAVIAAGDTNLKDEDDEPVLMELMQSAALRDACRELSCGFERLLDRVFVRDGTGLSLSVVGWERDERFVDSEGQALSDHDAVAVELLWAER